MKLRCEITKVEQCGDVLRVTLQGRPPRCAAWVPWGDQVIEIPSGGRSGATYYVGRIVCVELRP